MTESFTSSDAPPSSRWTGGAHAMKDAMTTAAKALASDARFSADKVTRPHPLLAMVSRNDFAVVLAPSAVWESGRELLAPFAARFAESGALLVLLGHPQGANLEHAVNRGLASIVPASPSGDELYLAVQRAFELLEAKCRAEAG